MSIQVKFIQCDLVPANNRTHSFTHSTSNQGDHQCSGGALSKATSFDDKNTLYHHCPIQVLNT